MQEIIKVNIDTGVGLPEDYNIILSTDDEDFSLEKVKGLTNEFSWDNPPPTTSSIFLLEVLRTWNSSLHTQHMKK